MTARANSTRLAIVAVGIVLVAFVALLASGIGRRPDSISTRLLGRQAPEIIGTTAQGTRFDLAEHRGRWVVVNFFATWCVPCRVEHPELVRFTEEHATAGDVQVVSIAFQDDAEAIDQYFERNGGEWPVIIGDTGRMALDFGVTGVPESFVVNPDGVIVAKFEGVTASGLNRAIDQAGGAVPGGDGT